MRFVLRNFITFGSLTLCLSETVRIGDGKIEGNSLNSRLNEKFYAFYQIPYGQPPVENLRFQAPLPVKKWHGILDGTKPGPKCFQNGDEAKMSEDCLHLNIFTKNMTASMPVIVFYHGGAFESGNALGQGPDYLMDRDVVLVAVNYRLGAFGFLAMGTKTIPGNAGMKDQVLALKWVNKNIKNFGGNKNQVTIRGNSAGAFAVTSHVAPNMSQGLFHRAIAMNGAITTAMNLGNDNKEFGEKLGEILSCENRKLFECLKKVKVVTL